MPNIDRIDLRNFENPICVLNLKEALLDKQLSRLTLMSRHLKRVPALSELIIDTQVTMMARHTSIDVGAIKKNTSELSLQRYTDELDVSLKTFFEVSERREFVFKKKLTQVMVLTDISNGKTIELTLL